MVYLVNFYEVKGNDEHCVASKDYGTLPPIPRVGETFMFDNGGIVYKVKDVCTIYPAEGERYVTYNTEQTYAEYNFEIDIMIEEE